MAINKKLIHFKTKANFEKELAANNILDTSICFIKDTQQIYTHNQLYDCNYVPIENRSTDSDTIYGVATDTTNKVEYHSNDTRNVFRLFTGDYNNPTSAVDFYHKEGDSRLLMKLNITDGIFTVGASTGNKSSLVTTKFTPTGSSYSSTLALLFTNKDNAYLRLDKPGAQTFLYPDKLSLDSNKLVLTKDNITSSTKGDVMWLKDGINKSDFLNLLGYLYQLDLVDDVNFQEDNWIIPGKLYIIKDDGAYEILFNTASSLKINGKTVTPNFTTHKLEGWDDSFELSDDLPLALLLKKGDILEFSTAHESHFPLYYYNIPEYVGDNLKRIYMKTDNSVVNINPTFIQAGEGLTPYFSSSEVKTSELKWFPGCFRSHIGLGPNKSITTEISACKSDEYKLNISSEGIRDNNGNIISFNWDENETSLQLGHLQYKEDTYYNTSLTILNDGYQVNINGALIELVETLGDNVYATEVSFDVEKIHASSKDIYYSQIVLQQDSPEFKSYLTILEDDLDNQILDDVRDVKFTNKQIVVYNSHETTDDGLDTIYKTINYEDILTRNDIDTTLFVVDSSLETADTTDGKIHIVNSYNTASKGEIQEGGTKNIFNEYFYNTNANSWELIGLADLDIPLNLSLMNDDINNITRTNIESTGESDEDIDKMIGDVAGEITYYSNESEWPVYVTDSVTGVLKTLYTWGTLFIFNPKNLTLTNSELSTSTEKDGITRITINGGNPVLLPAEPELPNGNPAEPE